jgi:hypothetical protein
MDEGGCTQARTMREGTLAPSPRESRFQEVGLADAHRSVKKQDERAAGVPFRKDASETPGATCARRGNEGLEGQRIAHGPWQWQTTTITDWAVRERD